MVCLLQKLFYKNKGEKSAYGGSGDAVCIACCLPMSSNMPLQTLGLVVSCLRAAA
jgi:hypothetical protein